MTGKELESAIDFLLQQHARFMEEMEQLKEAHKLQSKEIGQLKDVQERQSENIRLLADNQQALIVEMREGFDNLIIANEVTRDLAERIGQLTLSTSQRVTNLEKSQQ